MNENILKFEGRVSHPLSPSVNLCKPHFIFIIYLFLFIYYYYLLTSSSPLQPISGPVRDLAWSEDSKRIIAVGEGREKYAPPLPVVSSPTRCRRRRFGRPHHGADDCPSARAGSERSSCGTLVLPSVRSPVSPRPSSPATSRYVAHIITQLFIIIYYYYSITAISRVCGRTPSPRVPTASSPAARTSRPAGSRVPPSSTYPSHPHHSPPPLRRLSGGSPTAPHH